MQKFFTYLIVQTLLLVITNSSFARIPDEHRIRLAEAFRISKLLGEQVWTSWSEVPFSTLLIIGEKEYLIRHAKPSDEFISIGYDSLLGSEIWVRDRQFNPAFLACFPAVGGIPTVVVGTPENTGKDGADWIITLLHEHFHQLQYTRPDYYERVNQLGLSEKEDDGNWMLNYPFPYEDEKIGELIEELSQILVDGMYAPGLRRQIKVAKKYHRLQKKLKKSLSEKDYRYLHFQLWQEGIARYTELIVAGKVAQLYQPTELYSSLNDPVPLREMAHIKRETVKQELTQMSLQSARRGAFYPIGAAMGLWNDRIHPGWTERYFTYMFELEKTLNRN